MENLLIIRVEQFKKLKNNHDEKVIFKIMDPNLIDAKVEDGDYLGIDIIDN